MERDELIERYLDHLRELNRAKTTIATRRQMLYRHDRELPLGLAEANEDELRATIYRDDWDAKTQASNLTGLRSFFGWAVRRQELDFNPADGLIRPHIRRTLPRPPTDAQLADILDRAAEPYRLWVLLAAGEGMRCCEIAVADREHVTEGTFLVFGKGDKERMVPTHPAVWQAVRHLPPGPLARREDGGRATAHSVSKLAAVHFDDLGLPDVTLHRFRHWFGTSTLDACGNLRTVQELMGHASPTSTAVYTQVSNRARTAAVAALPVLAGLSDAA
jgi:integrase/recombinase XerC